ncbi:AtpZ/AtpI family protein [Calderihabitans maritimus]|uniref:F0F1-ATPase subunit n=1 Tax=Calderihabitans maritimus TaxID=1246530 RepID=A0A1Z5HWB7_9FIRM|nr:AtpZ/AtpI family protein [Calderihabitans maritimus]GAW93829.1 hypothetical protein Moth_2386 [Calderihabitans maritimus]
MSEKAWSYVKLFSVAASFGISTAVRIGLGWYAGNYLDQKFQTSPFLMFVGVLLGVGLSFQHLFTQLKVLGRPKRGNGN